jgi:hypothetical protein
MRDVLEPMLHFGLSMDKDAEDFRYQGGMPFWIRYCFMAYLRVAVNDVFCAKRMFTLISGKSYVLEIVIEESPAVAID